MSKHFIKDKPTNKVYEVSDPDYIGPLQFSFDKKKIYNLYIDYPHNLTPEEKKIFDSEYPY